VNCCLCLENRPLHAKELNGSWVLACSLCDFRDEDQGNDETASLPSVGGKRLSDWLINRPRRARVFYLLKSKTLVLLGFHNLNELPGEKTASEFALSACDHSGLQILSLGTIVVRSLYNR